MRPTSHPTLARRCSPEVIEKTSAERPVVVCHIAIEDLKQKCRNAGEKGLAEQILLLVSSKETMSGSKV